MIIDDVKISTLQKIKEVKEQNGLTIKNISDMLEKKGYSVSESTLKSIFSPNSDIRKHRYHDTIAPIADVLLDVYVKDNVSNDVAVTQLLREKDSHIDALVVRLNELETDYRNRINFLKDLCDRLEKRIDECNDVSRKLLEVILSERSTNDK